MTSLNTADTQHAFPSTRPAISIIEIDEPPFGVDCLELRAFPIIPREGEKASSADYALPGWTISEVAILQTLRPATLHKVEGVEIEIRVWKPESGWLRPGTIYARLTDNMVEFLGVHLPHEKFTQFETFLDDSFAWNWGALDREISDQGLVRRNNDGSITLSDGIAPGLGKALGFGLVRLEIGLKHFTCLRVLEAPGNGEVSDTDCVTESYITQQGRTLLVRRYCRAGFAEIAEFPVLLDESDQMVFNGTIFLHWYDTIMDSVL